MKSCLPKNFDAIHAEAFDAAKLGINLALGKHRIEIDTSSVASFNPNWDEDLSELIAQAMAGSLSTAEQPGDAIHPAA